MKLQLVIISAKEEQDASVSPAMDGLLKLHKRIVDGLDGELTQAPPNGQSLPTRLLVPATQVGTLIGKQGATKKSIQEASNCVVRILGKELSPVALQDDRVVEIQGDATGMHKAVELIASHLRKFLVDRTVLPLFEMHISMQQPPHIEQHMHQNMPPPQPWDHHPHQLPPNAGGGPGYGNPQFMHQRPQDKFYPPPDYPVEKPPHLGISTYRRDAPPMGAHPYSNQQPPMSSQVSMHHMQIPLSYADAVIGSAGSNISYIRRTSGAAISIQESRGVPGEMTAEINGTRTQIQTAHQLIQNFMAGAAPPAQGPGPNTMPPSDQGYGSYAHGPPPYASQANAGPPAHNGGGYASAYGTNYGY